MEFIGLPAIRSAERVIDRAITELSNHLVNLDQSFQIASDSILKCDGRLIVMGVGKSGHVGRKLAATFASTGTPSLYVHPTEALHGDLGMITTRDIVLVLSQSGESDEVRALLPTLRMRSAGMIAMTGGLTSTLAKAALVTVSTAVSGEACPHNLAPTTSTTIALTLGDALAVSVMEARGFSRSDYAAVHPAGSLGRRLTLTVHDLMRTGDDIAVVDSQAMLGDVIACITKARAGLACIIDAAGILVGVLTDGDIRRAFLTSGPGAWTGQVATMMTLEPATIVGNPLAFDTLVSFERGTTRIGDIPVLNEHGCPIGVLALKDLVSNGIIPHA